MYQMSKQPPQLLNQQGIIYSKTLRCADFGPKSISIAQKTVYLEGKTSKTVYLWGLVPKNDNQCNFWQNLELCIFKISASLGRVAQGLAVFSFFVYCVSFCWEASSTQGSPVIFSTFSDNIFAFSECIELDKWRLCRPKAL